MLLMGTMIILALCLAFWFVDPDDFRWSKKVRAKRASPCR